MTSTVMTTEVQHQSGIGQPDIYLGTGLPHGDRPHEAGKQGSRCGMEKHRPPFVPGLLQHEVETDQHHEYDNQTIHNINVSSMNYFTQYQRFRRTDVTVSPKSSSVSDASGFSSAVYQQTSPDKQDCNQHCHCHVAGHCGFLHGPVPQPVFPEYRAL